MISELRNKIIDLSNEITSAISEATNINDVDIYIDNSLKRFNFLFAAAGHPNFLLNIFF